MNNDDIERLKHKVDNLNHKIDSIQSDINTIKGLSKFVFYVIWFLIGWGIGETIDFDIIIDLIFR